MSPSICRTSCEADPAPAPAPAAGPTLVNGNGASPNGHSAGCSTSGRSAASPVDWSKVRLGVDPAPTMFVANWSAESCCWDGGQLVPYGPLHLLPAAQVLNYGQSIFEGMKAYRQADAPAPHILLFRPEANAARFEAGAARMCMPPVPPEMFLAAVHAVVRANADWVPPSCRGSLYVRPLLLGTGPLLGLCPAPSYTFVVYAVPVGGRAKEGRLTALDFLIHDSLHRAAPRGVGSTKAAGNYSPCLMAQAQARAQGCTDCIYLDARSDTYLEEGSGCNVFATHGRVLTTPPAAGSILPGITRASLLQLAGALGYVVREDNISVEAALAADEMFASGTAMVVQPIGSLTYKGRRPGSLPPGVGPVAQRLYGLLTGIQYGRVADPFGWAVPVDMNGPTEGELHLDRLLPVEEVEAEEEAAEAAPEAGGAKAVKKAGAAAGAGGAKANKPHAVFADPNLE
eukprot:XP_001701890.1 branched chain amino acid aminotransferase [Chlamydomonas reinhardtii]